MSPKEPIEPLPNVDPLADPKNSPEQEDATAGSEGTARTIGRGIYKEAEGGHEDKKDQRHTPNA